MSPEAAILLISTKNKRIAASGDENVGIIPITRQNLAVGCDGVATHPEGVRWITNRDKSRELGAI